MSKLLKFSRSYWEMAVACGGGKKNAVRNYDILKERESGKTLGQIAYKYGLTEMQISRIIKENQ